MAKICPECNIKYHDTDKYCPTCQSTLLTIIDKDPLLGRVIDDRFTIIEKLGAGGMGAVYKAKQHSLDKEVALKILRRELAEDLQAIKRFLREAKATSRLEHPNTIRVFDFGQTEDGLLFLAMELLKGKNLKQILKEETTIPFKRTINIIFQICDSLTEAHKKGMIHRDIKPENIFLIEMAGNPDFVKVLDFGLAKVVVGEQSVSLTSSGQIFGTPRYMSPEQAMDSELDARSDIYSLGVIFFEMLSGEKLFKGESTTELLLKIVKMLPPVITALRPDLNISPAVEALINCMLSKNPEERPQSAQAVKEALKAALEGSSEIKIREKIFSTSGKWKIQENMVEDDATIIDVFKAEGFTPSKGMSSAKYSKAPAVEFIKTKKPKSLEDIKSDVTAAEKSAMRKKNTKYIISGGVFLIIIILFIGYITFMNEKNTGKLITKQEPVMAEEKKEIHKTIESTSNFASNIDMKQQKDNKQEPEQKKIEVIEEKPPILKNISVKIISQPSGASVFENGKFIGETPVELKRHKNYETMLEFKLKGFQIKTEKITFNSNEELTINLNKEKLPEQKKTKEKRKIKPSKKKLPQPEPAKKPANLFDEL